MERSFTSRNFFTATTAAPSNLTEVVREDLEKNDAAWALSCAFLILTMQTGFAMLECGNVSTKNAASIMIKNCVDVTVGGFSYWCFGYGLTFGKLYPNPFCGIGYWFFTMEDDDPKWGTEYSHYFFHFSFASTATTIVSGAVAERMNFYAYIIFSFYNTVVYCVPASWAWNTGHGWLDQMGFFDFAGVCIVHYGGGVSALVAAKMLGPRLGRFDKPDAYRMSSPVTALTGMFMLWWAWMSFNAGSTFGVNQNLWKVSALAAVVTLNGGIAGGIMGLVISMSLTKGKVLINETVNSVLGGLVAVTGVCPLTSPVEALVIGGIGGIIAVFGQYLMEKVKIDDPVGAVPVHMLSAAWGTIAVGLFARDITGKFGDKQGLFHSGNFRQLLVQFIGLLSVTAWSGITTIIGFLILDKTMGIRTPLHEEILGADWTHHEIQTDTWNSQLFDDVIEKLTDTQVDDNVANHVLGELKQQLLKKQKSRANTPTKPQHKASELPAIEVPGTQSTQRDHGDRIPCPPSPRAQLREVVNVAKNAHSKIGEWRERTTGPMMLPLYKTFSSKPKPTSTVALITEERADLDEISDELPSHANNWSYSKTADSTMLPLYRTFSMVPISTEETSLPSGSTGGRDDSMVNRLSSSGSTYSKTHTE